MKVSNMGNGRDLQITAVFFEEVMLTKELGN
jgi:hypothetical protein